MEKLKVKVGNEAESKEVQELFMVLGGDLVGCKRVGMVAIDDGEIYPDVIGNWDLYSGREITLPELRDLVVLKRNDVGDKTHECDTTNSDYFVSSDNTVYFFDDEKTNAWKKSKYNLSELKPIEKTEMKEYLAPEHNYELIVAQSHHAESNWVEIPAGADTFAGDDNCHYFWQHRSGKKHLLIGCGSSLERYPQWVECEDSADEWLSNFDGDNSLRILWQREILAEEFKSKLPESTFKDFKQPEDLPFLDNGVDIGVENLPEFKPFNNGPVEQESKSKDFPLDRGDINCRAAIAFNAIRGTDLTEDDVSFLCELLNSITNHYGA